MALAIGSIDTVHWVPVSKATQKIAYDHFARVLRKWVEESCGNSQSEAKRRTGINQSHISAMIRAESPKRPGLKVLMAIREATGMSIDELLGLGPPSTEALFARFHLMLETSLAKEKREARLMLEEARETLARAQESERRAFEARALPPAPLGSEPKRRRRKRA